MISQKQAVLAALRSAPDGLCLTNFAEIDFALPYRARNVISELRASGVPIRSEVCKVHRHRSSVARYFLVTAPVQMAIAL